jgi:NO-binding membrane sensor protein with MHYT domain/two-component sensor histidine kinase
MPHNHHPIFVGLALLVAVFGSWTALDLFGRVRSHIGRARQAWLAMAAVAMGSSIWSMHFIAMLDFNPGQRISYDPGLTVLSLALAVVATWGAFFSAARERSGGALTMLAGAAMGAGICSMHYVGMAAIRTDAVIRYDAALVAASLLVAVTAGTAALFAAQRDRPRPWRAMAALILGSAVAGMHYTAMAALRVAPHADHAALASPPFGMAAGVAAVSLVVLFLAMLAALYDQRLNVLQALEAGDVGYWELSLRSETVQFSPRAKRLLRLDATAPVKLRELLAALSPDGGAHEIAALERAVATRTEFAFEVRLPGPAEEVRWIHVRGRVADPDDAPARRMVGVLFDVTERQEAFAAVADSERSQRLLIDELNHRVKNTLAAVQSISRQSAKRAGSLEDFRDLFESRLIALSQTHNALTRTAWRHARLAELLAEQLGPYPADQVRLDGPDVELAPREALALGMVFHELATNAAKYGALSARGGVVQVDWGVVDGHDGPELALQWRETGGPPVVEPARRGFGVRMIQGSIAGELGGGAALDFAPDGFRARLRVPLSRPESEAAA